MARCELTGKGPVVSNLVSHSNIKTKTKSYPNVQYKRVFSNTLNRFLRFKMAASTIRSMEHRGGLDKFILSQPDTALSKRALEVKSRILNKVAKKREV